MKKKNLIILVLFAAGAIFQLYKLPEKQKRKEIIKLYKEGEFTQSREKALVYLEKYPESEGMRTFLGAINLELGDTLNAEKAYLEGLALDPEDDKALVGLGVTARMQGNYTEAKKRYNQALRINAGNPQAYSSLLVLEIRDGNYAKAVALGEKAEKLMAPETSLGILGNLTIAYHFNNQIKERDQLIKRLEDQKYKDLPYLKMILNGTIDFKDFI